MIHRPAQYPCSHTVFFAVEVGLYHRSFEGLFSAQVDFLTPKVFRISAAEELVPMPLHRASNTSAVPRLSCRSAGPRNTLAAQACFG
jgi:hypothetical protein